MQGATRTSTNFKTDKKKNTICKTGKKKNVKTGVKTNYKIFKTNYKNWQQDRKKKYKPEELLATGTEARAGAGAAGTTKKK